MPNFTLAPIVSHTFSQKLSEKKKIGEERKRGEGVGTYST